MLPWAGPPPAGTLHGRQPAPAFDPFTAGGRAVGAGDALRWTKRALNHWIRNAGPIFEASLGFEMLNFFDDDVIEGAMAIKEKRAPKFPSVSGS